MKAQNIGVTNYQKQQNFGVLKINAKGVARLKYNQDFIKLLDYYKLASCCSNGLENGDLVNIIPTAKGSREEKAILKFIGQDVESIGINNARRFVANYLESLGFSKKEANAHAKTL